jgi:alcohol dehydrogenase class IV
MNHLKQLYCRTYQTAFHIAIPILPYRKPKLLSSVKSVPHILQKNSISKVMIVTDEKLRQAGVTEELEFFLKKQNIYYTIFDKTSSNPTDQDVEAARVLYIKANCQAIIAFGGGSSMDCAKALGARISKPRQSLEKMAGILKVHRKLPLLIAIPTTAGTGSETTVAAVITDAETRHKYPINDFPLIPKYAVLDPKVTLSLPPFMTATTGMDALTHAVEAYIGRSTTAETRREAIRAVQLIFKNIFTAYEDGSNLKARKNMLYASYLAGCAFTKSYVGYVHAVAHSLGGEYNVPHGFANAVLLPFVLEAYGPSAHKKLHELAIAVGISTKEESHAKGAAKFIQAIKQMKRRLNIGDTIEQIQEKDISRLAKLADKEGNPLYPVPRLMNANELERFYYQVMPLD